MTIFGIGPFELLIIILIALVVVGPERLPEMMFQLGQGINKAKKVILDLRNQARSELGDEYESIEEMSRQLRELDPRKHIQDLGRSLLDDPNQARKIDLDIAPEPKIMPPDKRDALMKLAYNNLDHAMLDIPLDELPEPVQASDDGDLLNQLLAQDDIQHVKEIS